MPSRSVDSSPQSWSKMMDNQRKREFRSKYQYSNYEPTPPKERTYNMRDTLSTYSSSRSSPSGGMGEINGGARVVAESGPIYIPSEAGAIYHATEGTHTLHLEGEGRGRPRGHIGAASSARTLSVDREASYPNYGAPRTSYRASSYATTGAPVSSSASSASRRYTYTDDSYLDLEPAPRVGSRMKKTENFAQSYERQKRKRDLQDQLEQTYSGYGTLTSQGENVNEIVKRVNAENYLYTRHAGALAAVPTHYTTATTTESLRPYDLGKKPLTRPSRTRSTSISRMCDESEQRYRASRGGAKRSQSLSRYNDLEALDDDYYDYEPRPRRSYGGRRNKGIAMTTSGGNAALKYGKSDYSSLLNSNILHGADDVKVQVLPSGQKKTTYTKFSQEGSGNRQLADAEIEKVIRNTMKLQETMDTLEAFVKNNRHLFPEDTVVYQQIRFFQLNEVELAQIGEPPEAVVYGVKIKEKLVVPPGTDVSEALRRYCGDKDSVEVQYNGRRQPSGTGYEVEDTEEERRKLEAKIRQEVEKDHEKRDRSYLLGQNRFEDNLAKEHMDKRDKYDHVHPHLTPGYIKGIYLKGGLPYESIYDKSQYKDRGPKVPSSAGLDIGPLPDLSPIPKVKRIDDRPQFSNPMRSRRALEGQSARFSCTVAAIPNMPSVIWMKGNGTISEGNKYKMFNDYGLLALEILNLKKEDSAVYTAKIINTEGEATTSATLEVLEFKDDTEDSTKGIKTPSFTLEPSNTSAHLGQKATFEAQVSGRPMPTFRWLRDNISLEPSDRIKMYSDEQGHCKLVINQVEPGDAGLYFCVAENLEGKTKSTATLRVKGTSEGTVAPAKAISTDTSPVIVKFDTPGIEGTAPWFVKAMPTTLPVPEGDPLSLQCIVDGDPKPRVTWLKEPYRELQYNERHRVGIDKDKHFLEIKSTLKQDAGRFILVAENKAGRATCFCWVNVLPPREFDEDGIEIQRSFVQMPDYEYDINYDKEVGNMAPRFVKKLPLEIEEKEGENLEVKCTVSEANVPDHVTNVSFTRKVVKDGDIRTVKVDKYGEVSVTSESEKAAERQKAASPEPEVQEEKPVTPEVVSEAQTEVEVEAAKPAENNEGAVAEIQTSEKEEPKKTVTFETPEESSDSEPEEEEEAAVVVSKEVEKPEEVENEVEEDAITASVSDRPEKPAPLKKQPTVEEQEGEGAEEVKVEAEVEVEEEVKVSEEEVKLEEEDQASVEEEMIEAVEKEKVEAKVSVEELEAKLSGEEKKEEAAASIEVKAVAGNDSTVEMVAKVETATVAVDLEENEETAEQVIKMEEAKTEVTTVNGTKVMFEPDLDEVEMKAARDRKPLRKMSSIELVLVKPSTVTMTAVDAQEGEAGETTKEAETADGTAMVTMAAESSNVSSEETVMTVTTSTESAEETVVTETVESTSEEMAKETVSSEDVVQQEVGVSEPDVTPEETVEPEGPTDVTVKETVEEAISVDVAVDVEVSEVDGTATEEAVLVEEAVTAEDNITAETTIEVAEAGTGETDGTATMETSQVSSEEAVVTLEASQVSSEEAVVTVETSQVSSEEAVATAIVDQAFSEVTETIESRLELNAEVMDKTDAAYEDQPQDDQQDEEVTIPYTLDQPQDDQEGEEVTIEVQPVSPVLEEDALLNVEVSEQFTLRVNTEPASKEESRAESVVSDRGIVTEEESWTEYSESLGDDHSEASVDTEDEVIEVKQVTKVRKVVEVGADGEKTVSKVTEVTKTMKEGGEVKETTERKEETGEDVEVTEVMLLPNSSQSVELHPDIPEGATVTEVRTVTKVQRVIEVSEDGEEKVVSKVTEVTTKVKEGDEVKETTERKEELGDSEEEETSSEEESSSEEDSSSEESSSDEEDEGEEERKQVTTETGKGEVTVTVSEPEIGKGEAAVDTEQEVEVTIVEEEQVTTAEIQLTAEEVQESQQEEEVTVTKGESESETESEAEEEEEENETKELVKEEESETVEKEESETVEKEESETKEVAKDEESETESEEEEEAASVKEEESESKESVKEEESETKELVKEEESETKVAKGAEEEEESSSESESETESDTEDSDSDSSGSEEE